MSETPFRSYGFTYQFGDKSYALDITATSKDEAKQRVLAIHSAEYIGELYADVDSTTNYRIED